MTTKTTKGTAFGGISACTRCGALPQRGDTTRCEKCFKITNPADGPSAPKTTREQILEEMAYAYIAAGKTLVAYLDYLQNVVIDEKKRRGEDAKI